MNWEQIEGNWKQFKGKVRERWGKLTDDDLTVIAGKKDQLLGKLQERYGVAKEQAQDDLDDFCDALLDQPIAAGRAAEAGSARRSIED